MKDQYFADKRDYFKWDFLEDLLCGCPQLQTLTNITMLTRNDPTHEGNQTKYSQGNRREKLYVFLQRCLKDNQRKVHQIRKYFRHSRFQHYPYRDDSHSYYKYDSRKEYFCSIEAEKLSRSLVFFDPDVGLQVGTIAYMKGADGKGLDKYLFNESLSVVSQRCSNDSAIVVYQHLQRNKNRQRNDVQERCGRFRIIVGSASAVFLRDRDIAFLVTSRQPTIYRQLKATVEEHAQRHGLDWDERITC